MRVLGLAALAVLGATPCFAPCFAQSLIPPPSPPGIAVPDWALPQSPTHKQVAPPEGFHRASVTTMTPIGIFDGQSDAEMGETLHLSKNTIRNHVASLYAKIGVNRRAAAVIWARERGFTAPDRKYRTQPERKPRKK